MIDETKEGEKNHPTIAEAQADAQSEAGERMAQIDRFEKQEREKFEKTYIRLFPWYEETRKHAGIPNLLRDKSYETAFKIWLERAKEGEEDTEIIRVAKELTMFAKNHEYPEVHSQDFIVFTGVIDKLDILLRKKEAK